MARLLENPAAPADHAAYCQVIRQPGKGKKAPRIMGYSVRSQWWRYTEWGSDGKHGRELYDHDADPHEFKNLAVDPEHAKTVAEMRQLLKRIPPAGQATP